MERPMSAKPTLSVRSPKNNLEDFVSGGQPPAADVRVASVQLPEVEPLVVGDAEPVAAPVLKVIEKAAESVRRQKMRGVVTRADGEERARVSAYLELDAAAKLRRHCFENGLELSEVAAKAIECFVAKL
jgi:hypothetical protein